MGKENRKVSILQSFETKTNDSQFHPSLKCKFVPFKCEEQMFLWDKRRHSLSLWHANFHCSRSWVSARTLKNPQKTGFPIAGSERLSLNHSTWPLWHESRSAGTLKTGCDTQASRRSRVLFLVRALV